MGAAVPRPPGSTLTFGLLPPSPGPAFGELLAIYTEAFPFAERKPLSTLRAMLANPAYRFFIATQRGTCVGFAIAVLLADSEAALLEYMAVREGSRAEGVGRWLFRETVRAVLTGPCTTLLVEVESDRIASPEQPDRRRRKRFYTSLGARELEGLAWKMPPVGPATPPPMEMLVYGPHTATLPRTTLKRWLAALYVEVYRQLPTDPQLRTMLDSLPEHIPLL